MQTFTMKECVIGDTIDSYNFAFKNGDNPADISGTAFALTLSHHRESNYQIKYHTLTGTGINTITVASNIVTLPQVPDEQTANIRPGKYVGQFEVSKDGERKVLFKVELIFLKNIS
jgi:hypothetical protein